MSPAAYTPGAPALSVASHTMPSRNTSELSVSQSVTGVTPMPTTITSLATDSPPLRRTTNSVPLCSMPCTCTPQRTGTPLSVCNCVTARPISAPRPRISGAGAPSSTTTSLPNMRAVAATSRPIKPAPMMVTRRLPASIRARSDNASSSVRNSKIDSCSSWLGRRRVAAPVASTTASYDTTELSRKVTVLSVTERADAATPRRSCNCNFSSSSGRTRAMRSGSHSPDRTFFDSGGRSYGVCGSAPIKVMSPSKP